MDPIPEAPEELAELAGRAGLELEGAGAEEVLRWAGRTFGSRLAVASSMADTHLVHLAAGAVPGVDVLFLDTGYHFAETLGTRDACDLLFDVNLRNITPAASVAEQDAEHGPRLYERQPDLCCKLRKVVPLNETLAGYAAWVTGMRRAESSTRAEIPVVEFDEKRNMVKVNPLADWTDEDVEQYIAKHNVIVNPLLTDGYASVGCEPCTRRGTGREGRWTGLAKTECGLHT